MDYMIYRLDNLLIWNYVSNLFEVARNLYFQASEERKKYQCQGIEFCVQNVSNKP